jgi:hypothetical protein
MSLQTLPSVILATLTFSMAAFSQAPYQVRYVANLAAGDSLVNISNTGASGAGLTTPPSTGLNGNLSLSSHGTGTIAVNGTQIDFDYTGGVTTTFPPTATGAVDGSGDSGLFDVTNASTSSFTSVIGTNVTVHDLDAGRQPTGTTSGPGLPLSSFVTFATQPGWSITLTEIMPGTSGSAGCSDPAGTQCTPNGSPFNLTNEGGKQVLVGFSFVGIANDGLGNSSPAAGTFTTTFSNTTYQQILADLSSGEAIVSSASATIAVSVGVQPGNPPGNICANVYAFTPDEQLVSCCSCPVTPDGLVSLSAKRDLASNTLTPAVPSALVIKLLATVPVAGSCNNSAAAVTTATLANGMLAWGTTVHATPATGVYGVSETPFSPATLSTGGTGANIGELARLGSLCNFIIANGSGFGQCNSCRLGGLGAVRQ